MLFVFDWDGTLSDSTEKIIVCMQRATEALSLPQLVAADVRNIIGLGLPEAIASLYSAHSYAGVSERDRRALAQEYGRQFTEADQVPSAFFPGVLEVLSQLHLQGHKLAVATGKSRRGLDRVLQRLDLQGFFHASRCADETASKPDPKMLRELLAEFDCDVSFAVMIGDTEYDMEMACRIGMARVAVSFGAHDIERLRGYNPVLCIDDMSQLLNLELNLGLS